MNTQTITTAAKDVLESSRGTLVNVIRAGHGSTRGALKACDQLTKTSADMLASVPTIVATTLRNDIVSIEGQLTLVAGMLAGSAAATAEGAANRVARAASGTVDGFEQVFDLRVKDALVRAGVPSAELIQELAERIAVIARDVTRLSDLLQPLPGKHNAERSTSAVKSRAKPRKSTRTVTRKRVTA